MRPAATQPSGTVHRVIGRRLRRLGGVAAAACVALAACPSAARAAPGGAQNAVLAAPAVAAPAGAGAAPRLNDAPGALRLREAEAMSLRLVPSVRVAEAGVAFAQAKQRLALAAWLPQLGAVGTYSRQTANFVLRPGSLPLNLSNARSPTSRAKSYNYWNFGLTLNQMVYDFGVTSGSLAAARAALDAGRHQLADAELAAVQAARLAYFDAAAKQAQIALAEETLANMRRHLHQIDQQVRVGQRAPIELASANTDVAQAEVARIGAQNAWDTARASLRQALGAEGLDEDFVLRGDVMAPVPGEDAPLEVLVRRASDARPDLAAQRATVAQAEATRRGGRGALLPSLNASAGVTEAGEHLDNMGWNWNVGASLSWSLFNGGGAFAALRQAEAQLTQAKAQANVLRLALRAELEKNRLAVAASSASCGATEVAEDSARTQLRLAEGRYARGLGNVIELSDAQVAVNAASAARIAAIYGLAQARANLARSLALAP